MKKFSVGDHVRWKSEAGKVSGMIVKIIRANLRWKGYLHHASSSDPQYIIKSDKSEHVAIHKASALRIAPRSRKKKPQKGGAS
jgi:DUF2945 family protein